MSDRSSRGLSEGLKIDQNEYVVMSKRLTKQKIYLPHTNLGKGFLDRAATIRLPTKISIIR